MTNENSIVPVIPTDTPKPRSLNVLQKPKLACQLKIDVLGLRIYNGANQYILTTILKELHHVN